MITREQFQERINSFDFTDEQKEKCLMYYDNPSKSTSKETVIYSANADDLWKTVNRWYGIKNSTKEKKPRTSKKKSISIEEYFKGVNEFVDAVIASDNDDDIYSLMDIIKETEDKIGKVIEEREKKSREEYNNILKAIKEYNKKNNTNYNLVNKIDEE